MSVAQPSPSPSPSPCPISSSCSSLFLSSLLKLAQRSSMKQQFTSPTSISAASQCTLSSPHMEKSISPIVHKVAGEIAAKPKRCFARLTEICLEDWWLSKLDDGKGLAVSGRPIEKRKCYTAQKTFHSAPARMRFASREFHSKVVKRHGCTTLETSDGMIVSLCGFINKSRTQQNGFSSEVCRDFIVGFPYNWDDYATSVYEDLSQSNPKDFTERILPAALDDYNDAQLHNMVLSLTDAERDQLNKKVYDNLITLLSPQPIDVIEAQPSKFSTQVDADVSNSGSQRTEASNKRQTRSQTSSKKEPYKKVSIAVSSNFMVKLRTEGQTPDPRGQRLATSAKPDRRLPLRRSYKKKSGVKKM